MDAPLFVRMMRAVPNLLSSVRRVLSGVLGVVILSACTSTAPYVAQEYDDWKNQPPPGDSLLSYRVFLIGDAGAATPDSPTIQLLRTMTQAAGEQSTTVFLGDNIYCCGLPDSSAADRAEAEMRLRAQLDAVKDAPGQVFFIPGNHDWNDDLRGGRAALARQEAFVEAYLERGNTFLPNDGFPGPIPIKLTDDLTLIALDTQWWLSDERPFGDTGDYRLREPTDFLLELQEILVKHRKGNVIVVGHHPVVTNGPHGGRFPAKRYLRPIPLISAFTPLYRRFGGNRQDVAHAKYKLFRRELVQVFDGWPESHLIYASGHDHSLQYFERRQRRTTQHYIVSGSGSKVNHVARGRGAAFSAAVPGFVTLQYYADGSVWLEAWTPNTSGSGKLLYRHQMKPPPQEIREDLPALTDVPPESYPDYRDSTVTAPINASYADVNWLRERWFGTNNRDLWAIPVTAPVLDVERFAGGLTPIKLSGQSQSTTLWLQGNDGKTYMVRSIDKETGRSWPADLQRTFARDLVQDQISMLHPFAAFLVPKLANAVGVYHTNPRLVFIPDDPRLGPYRSALAGTIAMIEERPDEDLSDIASMGNTENAIGFTKLMQEINGDNDHRVDGYMWARARLLDMLIADFDRTSDNWRWGEFEPDDGKGKIYRPIPRDRDAAMMRPKGILPWIYKTRFENTWQGFGPSYGNLKGLNKKGLGEDRRFAAALSPAAWVAIADSMRTALTDSVFEAAIQDWPPLVREAHSEETLHLLRVRRDQLSEVAAEYGRLLARVVDVVGSHKHERFEVVRGDNTTTVTVYKTSKEGEIRKQLYHRVFDHDETREVRLYGQDGNDTFLITGRADDGLLLRVIGGPGEDTFRDEARLDEGKHRTRLYDNATGNHMTATEQTLLVRSDDPAVNRYDPYDYRFGQRWPLVSFGSNKDDGLFLGGGAVFTRHRFRRHPFASTHRIVGNVAAKTQAFNLWYQGYFTLAWRQMWDLSLDVQVLFPENIRNFYGLGNETTRDAGDSRFYQAQLAQIRVQPSLIKPFDTGVRVHVGPTFSYTRVREADNRFIGQPQAGVSDNTFDTQWFGGAEADITLSTRDNVLNPKQGFHWTSTANLNLGLTPTSDTHSQLGSDFRLYISPSLAPQITLATRFGGRHNIGSFPFYEANTLGGKSNLRGYRSTRFAGRTSFFANVEARMQVLDFAGYLAFGRAGVLGFVDNGRVWTDDESSDTWHQGYGLGGWLELFQATVITATADFSDEDRLFSLRLGFLF